MSGNKWIESNAIRTLARVFVRWGDNIRPIVQKPIIDSLIRKYCQGKSLDAGCGRGLYTPLLGELASQVDAIDLQTTHVEAQMRRKRTPNITFRQGSVTELPFAENQYDFVLFSEVIEHIEDDRLAVREIQRVMKTGGKLLISTPQPPAPIDDKEHVREGYTTAELTGILEQHGFAINEVHHCMYALSKTSMRIEQWWTDHISRVVPTPIFLLAYIERFMPTSLRPGKPYDIIVVATLTKPKTSNQPS